MDGRFRPKPNGQGTNNNRTWKNVGFVIALLLLGLVVVALTNQSTALKEIPLTQAVQQANAGDYSKIVVNSNELDITKKGDTAPTLKTFTEPNATLKDEGFDYSKVQITAKPASNDYSTWLTIGTTVVPVLL